MVKNLIGKLSKVNETDIRGFFSVFGEIENIEIDIDPITGHNKGQAIVQFTRSQDAQAAIDKMNGFIISDTAIIVTKLPYYLTHNLHNDLNDDSKRGSYSSISRAYLASKLAGADTKQELTQKLEDNEIEIMEKKIKRDEYWSRDETRILGLFNLIDPQKVKDGDQKFIDDIVEDVRGELKRRMF